MNLLKYIFLFLICLSVSAQVQHGGTPLSISEPVLQTSDIPVEIMPTFDLEKMLIEDEELNIKGNPFRFGKAFDVSFNLENSGLWETLPNGDRIWRLTIYSKNAHSLNFLFDDFFIPEGAKLFFYNENYEDLLGAFTEANNKPFRRFSTTVIKGDKITVEYYEPLTVSGKGIINFKEVVHGYRNFFDKAKGYGDSGSCNINVNCDIAEGWEDQINSGALILYSGFRLCSGAMINNVREDGTPFFLTADHCRPNDLSVVQFWNLMFNYQSPECSNSDGNTNMTVSGCIFRAKDGRSDFMLLELSSPIPTEYNVYFSGWDRSGAQPQQGVGIHHPAGDVKKISFDRDPLNSVNTLGGGENFWEVADWDDGTTEGGSSGSPIFNENKLIVGQLFGGDAACGNDLYDVYGKLSSSWGNYDNFETSLAPWLDPNNESEDIVEGAYVNDMVKTFDASINLIEGFPSSFCEQFIDLPNFTFKNNGQFSLTSATINWQIDNEPAVVVNWSGNLDLLEEEIISLPTSMVNAGDHVLKIEVVEINGGNASDENLTNNVLNIPFTIAEGGQTLEVTIVTDEWSEETSFDLTDSQDNVILSSTSLVDLSANTFGACLQAGCYEFTIYDSFGDGICCDFGDGNYSLNLSIDGEIASGNGVFTSSESVTFCIEGGGSLPQLSTIQVSENKVCTGESVDLSFNGSDFNFASWTFEPNVIGPISDTNPSVTIEDPGVYTASLLLTNNFGTTTQSITFEVVAYPTFETTIIDNTLLDFEGSILVNASENSSIVWGDGNTDFSRNDLTEGVYDFSIFNEAGCEVQGTAEVQLMYDSPIYPNPVTEGSLNIYNPTQEAGQVKFYTINGQQLADFAIKQGRNRLDLSDLSAGLYFVHIDYSNEKIIKKILVN